jgi:hypothetical protein
VHRLSRLSYGNDAQAQATATNDDGRTLQALSKRVARVCIGHCHSGHGRPGIIERDFEVGHVRRDFPAIDWDDLDNQRLDDHHVNDNNHPAVTDPPGLDLCGRIASRMC